MSYVYMTGVYMYSLFTPAYGSIYIVFAQLLYQISYLL